MKAEIKKLEDEFWGAREDMMRQEEEEWLASEGSSALRSEQPSEALNQPQTQKA